MKYQQPFQTIEQAAQTTGLSTFYLRQRCRANEIPFVRSGKKYLINVPALLLKLGVPLEENNVRDT